MFALNSIRTIVPIVSRSASRRFCFSFCEGYKTASLCKHFIKASFSTMAQSNRPNNIHEKPKVAQKDNITSQIDPLSIPIDEACDLLRSRDLSMTDIDKIALSFGHREDVQSKDIEIAFRALFRINYCNQILHLYNLAIKLRDDFQLTTSSLEIVLDAAIREKQFTYVDIIWTNCSEKDRHRWGILSRYIHAMLADRRLNNAREYLFLLEREEYTIPVANSHVLQGLYEGGYYEECLQFFKGLLPLDVTYKLLGDADGIFAALLSAYELKQYHEVISIFNLTCQLHFHASRSILYIVTEIYEKGDFWRKEYDQRLNMIKSQGVTLTDKQLLHILAQCRLPQLLEGSRLLNHQLKSTKKSILAIDNRGNYRVNLSMYDDSNRKLRLISVLDEVADLTTKEQKSNCLLVNTVNGDKVLPRLLRAELYPSISFVEHLHHLSIPSQSILNWKNHREDPVL